jgi:Arylsulfotransferase (ASST)
MQECPRSRNGVRAHWVYVLGLVALLGCEHSHSGGSLPSTFASIGGAGSSGSAVSTAAVSTTAVSTASGHAPATAPTAVATVSASVPWPPATSIAPATTATLPAASSSTANANTSDARANPSDKDAGAVLAPTECQISVTAELGKIPTVGVVTFTTNQPRINVANIEFGPVGAGLTMVAPVDLDAANHRTFLLGMKQAKAYAFRVVLEAGDKTCTSDEQTLTTGTLSIAPIFTADAGSGTRGFVLGVYGDGPASTGIMYIADTDGDLVWAHEGPPRASRARLDWNSRYMWGMAMNESNRGGRVDRVSLDGEEVEASIPALSRAHHDLTPLPNGHIALLSHTDPASGEDSPCAQILDYDPVSKMTSALVADISTLYTEVDRCHPNALTYQKETNTFIVSDRNANLFVKFSAEGTPIWQLGGLDPIALLLSTDGDPWIINHGHQLTAEGRFVFFNNSGSKLREYHLDEVAGTAQAGATIDSPAEPEFSSSFLGDVQILKNGNLWATYSQGGAVCEYDASGTCIAKYRAYPAGYTYFMESLYENPVK